MNIFKRRPSLSGLGRLTSQKSIALVLVLQIFLGLSFYGCKKDNDRVNSAQSDDRSAILTDKVWYEAFTNGKAQSVNIFDPRVSNTTLDNSDINVEKLIVDWSLASTLQTNEKTIVEVPVKGELLFSLDKSTRNTSNTHNTTSLLILTTSKKKSAYYMSIITEPGYKEKVSYSYQPKTFSGTILYFNLQGKLVVTQVFRNGAVIGVGTPTSKRKSESKNAEGNFTTMLAAPACNTFDVYREVTTCTPSHPEVPCHTYYYYVSSYTLCSTPTAPGTGDTPPPSSGGGYTPPPSTPCLPGDAPIGPVILRLGYGVNVVDPNPPTEPTFPGDPNPPTQPTPTVPVVPCPETTLPYDIINKIDDPCMRTTINQAITNKSVVGFIGDQIRRYGGAGVMLKINDGPTANGSPSQITNINITGNVFNAEITFAPSFYQNTTKEYLIAALGHEVLHAYLSEQGLRQRLNFQPVTVQNNHNVMANEFVGDLAAYISSNFNIPDQDAYSLALFGLGGSELASNLPGETLIKYNSKGDIMELARLRVLATAYNEVIPPSQQRTKGTPICN